VSTNGVCSHDDVANVTRRPHLRPDRSERGRPGPTGWSNPVAVPDAPRRRRAFPTFLLLLPLVVGLLGAPGNTATVRGDELSDARAKQAALKKEVAAQKAQMRALNDLQAGLAAEIDSTKTQLRSIGADLTAVRRKITRMESKIDAVKAAYANLVLQVRYMDIELSRVQADEAAKRDELAARRALLADRIRNAYDSDRTSPLETFLSGGTFTDMLAEMSYYIDVGEQDKALAAQIARDKETLAAIHQTVADTRTRTDALRLETAAQKRALDKSLRALNDTKKQLRALEKAVAKTLAQQKARYAAIARNKAAAARIIAKAAADQAKLAKKIDALVAAQVRSGSIPSRFNGTMRWPMDRFTISGEYGCSSFEYYAPGNGCAHYHNGIDLVGPTNAPIRAAAAGVLVTCGWNWADGADPAWIVVIAHAGNVRTWYAHMQPGCPVGEGQRVKRGQIIGTQGSTGHATGDHLHWMVEMSGRFVNPRLFL
jgi:murein DD-endopeptidase MepM/ murein hydrolase activator NlpD